MTPMSFEIRVCPPERFAELIKTAEVAFSEDVPDDLVKRVEAVSDKERFLCAMQDDRFVATSGVFGTHLSVPGGEVPAGGIAWVTVLPTHRRRGIMSGMMRRMIDDCHRRREPIAMLWAAEGAIYQRFGFGLGTLSMNLEAEARAVGFAREWPSESRFRLLPAGEGREIVEPVYEAARAQRSGFLSRTPDWWAGILPDAEKDKKGGEAKRLVVYETDAGAEAYAVYKTKAEWNVRGPGGTLTVEEAIGWADIVITATGNQGIITLDHMRSMKHQAILGNIGHFDDEIEMARLERDPDISRINIKPQVDEWTFTGGPSIIVLSEGRLLNLGNATGHPSFVMSNSFSNQVIAQIELWTKNDEYDNEVYRLPKHLDEKVAKIHVEALGGSLTRLTKEQA